MSSGSSHPRASLALVSDRALLEAWAGAPEVLRPEIVCDWLLAHARLFLKLDEREEIGPQSGFLDLGFDSLLAVDFKLILEKRLDCELRSTVVFDCPTPAALAAVLDRELAARPAALRAGSAAGATSPEKSRTRSAPLAADAASKEKSRTRSAPLAADAASKEKSRTRSAPLAADAASKEKSRTRSAPLAADAASLDPIAIVGMACRFPGGVQDPEAYWRLLVSGVDAITEIPPERWSLDEWYDPDRAAIGKMYVRHGGFLAGAELFDAAFFGISPREAQELDPQQRLLLETAWEALESAGIAPTSLRGEPVAVYVGTRGSDYFVRHSPFLPEVVGTYNAAGNALSTAAGRISYTLGLTGPCFALDTACSSSLVALHQAMAALRSGECSLALAAGVNLILDPVGTVSTCKAGMLSPGGRCSAFSAHADGYVRSEGCGTIVLEPLSAARRAGHRVLALVRGSAINQDGASGGLTVPSGAAQAEVIRLALAQGGVDAAEVDYVEAHGTGTALGDPIEVQALDEVYGKARGRAHKLKIASVKTNIGHCETAAGMAGLIKAVLAMRHGVLPPLLHCEPLSPHIPWNEVAVEPLRALCDFPHGARPRRVGVSSFGFSGTNGHVVLEEAPAEPERTRTEARSAELVALSAATPKALAELAGSWAAALAADPALELADLAFTAGTGRAHLRERCALLAHSSAELDAGLRALAEDPAATPGARGSAQLRAPRVAFLFTGQGSQRAGMGRGLYEHCPVFRSALDECAQALAAELDAPLIELLWGARSGDLARTEYTQPALFALEVALSRLWASLGIVPTWSLGHSVGEYAAACVAGVFSVADGARLIAARGRLMRERAAEGAMLVAFAPAERVAAWVEEAQLPLDLAADNGPENCTWSGELTAVEALERLLKSRGLRAQRLEVSHAFHSRLMEPVLEPLAAIAREIPMSAPRLGLISNLSGTAGGAEMADPARWVAHVRSPVRFAAGLRALLSQDVDALLEIGPAPVLLGLAKRVAPGAKLLVLPSLRAGKDEWESLLAAVGELYALGAEIDWRALHAGRQSKIAALPTYPFQRERHWLELRTGPALAPRASSSRLERELLGERLTLSVLGPGERLHERGFSATEPAWLAGHEVFGAPIAPAALYLELALESARAASAASAVELTGVAIRRALSLAAQGTRVQTHLVPEEGGSGRFRIASFESREGEETWTEHATGRWRGLEPLAADASGIAPTLGELRARCTRSLDPTAHYAAFAQVGIEYSGAFRAIAELWRGDEDVLAKLQLDAGAAVRGSCLHPALLDACFQSCSVLMPESGRGLTYLPVGLERLLLQREAGAELWCHARLARSVGAPGEAPRLLKIDFDLFGAQGEPVARLEGLQIVQADARALLQADTRPTELLYEIVWRPSTPPALPAASRPGSWLLLADESGVAERLALALGEAGLQVAQVRRRQGWNAAELERALAECAGMGPLIGVVHLWSLDRAQDQGSAALEPVCGSALALAQALARAGTTPAPRLWLVTRGAQAVAPSPWPLDVHGAALWGLGATIAHEHPQWRCTRIDLDPAGDEDEATRLSADLLAPDAELQLAWRLGERRAARLVRSSSLARLEPPDPAVSVPSRDAGADIEGSTWALRVGAGCTLEDLSLLSVPRRAPAAHEIEIEVEACGLNFKDVLYALGMLREYGSSKGHERAEDWPLGMEACGRVVRAGADVADLRVGERVVCMGTGLLARHVTVWELQATRAPRSLTSAEAAAQPIAQLTAMWALERVAELRAGDLVLVHAAAGGVGQAAIRVAQAAGAEVVATASRPKWAHLKRMGVRHVLDSRAAGFADEILRLTDGGGVDVVLNSLGGEAIPESLRALARGGRFVEIGKIGIWTTEQVAATRPDVRYSAFDLEDELAKDPHWMRRTLDQWSRDIDSGVLEAVPVSVHDMASSPEAFERLAKARAIGKLALRLPLPAFVARAEISHLITGGLGGLGLEVASWLVERGARTLVLASRGEPGEDAQMRVAQLRERGARVELRRLDVSSRAGLAELFGEFGTTLPALGGIVHAAGVLDDGVLGSLDWPRFARVLAPKLDAAGSLSDLTRAHDLDYCALFASMSGLLGSSGQASYAAANASLDALARNAATAGRRWIALDWGPWSDAGMAARLDERQRGRLTDVGLRALPSAIALAALERALELDRPQVAVMDVRWERYVERVGAAIGPLCSELARARATEPVARATAAAGMRVRLDAAPAAERPALLEALVAQEVARVTGLGGPERVERQRRFLEMGVDSLQAVELRNRLEQALETSLPATLLFDQPTLAELVQHLATIVLGSTAPAGAAAPAGASAAAGSPGAEERLLSEIVALSEEEAVRQLASERADG